MPSIKTDRRFRLSSKISKSGLTYFFLSAIIIRPDYLLQFPIIYRLYSIGSLVALIYVCTHLPLSKDKLPSSMMVLVFLGFWTLLSTLLNGSSIKSWWDAVEVPVVSAVLCYYGMRTKPDRFIHSIECLLLLYLLINFLTILLFPKGMDAGDNQYVNGQEMIFFLGQKNVIVKFSLLAEFCVILESYFFNGKCRFLEKVVSIIVFGVGIYTNSGVTIVASLIPLFFSFIQFDKVPKFINALSGAVLNAAFFILIVIFRKQELFSFFIEGVLGKNLTFTSRTRLWDIGLVLASKHIMLGNGIEDKAVIAAKAGFNNDSFHNFIVDYLYQGGIVLIVLWCIFLILLYFDIKKCSNVAIVGIGNVFSFAYLIVAISEPFTRSRVTAFIIFAVIITMVTTRISEDVQPWNEGMDNDIDYMREG